MRCPHPTCNVEFIDSTYSIAYHAAIHAIHDQDAPHDHDWKWEPWDGWLTRRTKDDKTDKEV